MPDIFWMCVVWAVVLALFGLLALVAWRDARRYRHWSIAEGKIVSSRGVFRPNAPGDSNYDSSDSELLNMPQVEFEYRVGDEILRGSRISIVAYDDRFHSLKPTLDRYPMGKIVPVFFDPENPKNAALERTPSKSDYVAFSWLLLAGLVLPWLIAVFYCQIHVQVKPRIHHTGAAQIVSGVIVIGSFFVLMAVGAIGIVLKSWTWPVAQGRIKSSSVDSFRVSSGDSSYISYKPRVLFAYEVDGQKYTGDRIVFSFVLGGMGQRKAKRIADRYRANDMVDVYYDPKKPADSVLRRSARALLLFPILAAVFLGIAWAWLK